MKSANDYPVDIHAKPDVNAFFDDQTNTISYVVADPESKACAIIDSVLNINYASGQLNFDQADALIEYIESQQLKLEWIIETHVHADHLSAAPYLQEKLGGKLGIGEKITEVQEIFGKVFNEGTEFQRDGSQFDQLFTDGSRYQIGDLKAFTIATPGHTPACMVHVIGDAAFVGDTLFMPDAGSGRTDFPGGDSGDLYDSIQMLLSLPDEMRVFVCHDYGPGGRDIGWETTIGEEKKRNIHFANGMSRDEFKAFRDEQDKGLDAPRLIIPSLQVNMRAGDIPRDPQGNMMLKVPLNRL